MTLSKVKVSQIVAAMAAVGATASTSAQVLEEIVVTAQKRSESLQSVPISMNAFTGESLRDLGVANSEDVLKLLPAGQVRPAGGNKQNFFIRGVGTNDFQLNVVSAVGVYLDDVVINSPAAVSFSSFDVERVEVLRGPQNTLFGRNTTGGAVNYVSRKPELNEDASGYALATYGRFNQIDLEGAVSFPLGDSAAVRLSGQTRNRDGVFESAFTGVEAGTIDRQAFRGQLLFSPTDTFDGLLNVRYGRSSNRPIPYKVVGTLDPNDLSQPCAVPLADIDFTRPPPCADAQGNVFQFSDWEDVGFGLTSDEEIDTWGTSLHLNWDIGENTLTSITSFDVFEYGIREDTDGAPTLIFNLQQYGDYDQFSQELRLVSPDGERFRWMGGFYYFLEEADYETAVRRTPAPAAPSGMNVFNTVPNTQVQQDNEVISFYGQIEYDLRDDLTLTAGYRWTNETKEGTNTASVRCVGVGGPPFCTPNVPDDVALTREFINTLPALVELPTEDLDFDEDEWGGRLSLDYSVNDDVLLFASISRGFKGGGFSIAPLTALTGNTSNTVEPEILTAYEVGFKTTLADGNVELNGAVYFYDWENLQSFQPTFDPDLGSVVPQLVNFPEASMLGGELELQAGFGQGWYLGTGINVNESEFDDVGDILGAQEGNTLINNPEFSLTGVLRKDIELSSGTVSLQTNWRYKDDISHNFSEARQFIQEAYWNVAARASYAFGDNEQYRVSLWGDNLTGEEVCLDKGSLLGLTDAILCQQNLSDPTFGITGRVEFD